MDEYDTNKKYKVFFIDIESGRILQEIIVEAMNDDEAETIAEYCFDYDHFDDIDFDCEVKLISDPDEIELNL